MAAALTAQFIGARMGTLRANPNPNPNPGPNPNPNPNSYPDTNPTPNRHQVLGVLGVYDGDVNAPPSASK